MLESQKMLQNGKKVPSVYLKLPPNYLNLAQNTFKLHQTFSNGYKIAFNCIRIASNCLKFQAEHSYVIQTDAPTALQKMQIKYDLLKNEQCDARKQSTHDKNELKKLKKKINLLRNQNTSMRSGKVSKKTKKIIVSDVLKEHGFGPASIDLFLNPKKKR